MLPLWNSNISQQQINFLPSKSKTRPKTRKQVDGIIQWRVLSLCSWKWQGKKISWTKETDVIKRLKSLTRQNMSPWNGQWRARSANQPGRWQWPLLNYKDKVQRSHREPVKLSTHWVIPIGLNCQYTDSWCIT